MKHNITIYFFSISESDESAEITKTILEDELFTFLMSSSIATYHEKIILQYNGCNFRFVISK